jgi:hypothetical protein
MSLNRFRGVVPQPVERLLSSPRPASLLSGRRPDLGRLFEAVAADKEPWRPGQVRTCGI